MIASTLNWIKEFFLRVTSSVLDFLSMLLSSLFAGLIAVLKSLFSPVLIIIAIIFYLIYKISQVVILLFSLFLEIGKLLYAFVAGFYTTISSLTWTPSEPHHGSWTSAIQNVFLALAPYQLDKIAYLITFAIWVMTAYQAIKMMSGDK